jgi:hypothetical protein
MESYQHTQMRVRLAKRGVSQILINDLFRNFSINEIETAPARLNAVFNLLNENGNIYTFQLCREVVQFLLANKNAQDFTIRCIKTNSGYYRFIIGEN